MRTVGTILVGTSIGYSINEFLMLENWSSAAISGVGFVGFLVYTFAAHREFRPTR